MNNLIAVSIGDIRGIGLEILLKLWKNNKVNNFVLFTNKKILKNYLKDKNLKIKLNSFNLNNKEFFYDKNILNIYDFKSKSLVENTYKSIKIAHHQCNSNNFIGLITLPISKKLIINKIDKKFIGHTEFLQKLENKKFSNMILINEKIKISTLTTHININSISNTIRKKNYIYNQISNLNYTLIKDFNIKNPRIIISGLNPHSGESGKIGNEEIKIIKPEINKLKKEKINIHGPISADSMLIDKNINYYDCFVFIFHDQALIPFKYISKFTGINYTGNLNIIRTSPDHGTAYDLVGSNNISTKSLENCFKLIKHISKNRKKYEESKKVIRSKFFKR